jgi:hypothetical protein
MRRSTPSAWNRLLVRLTPEDWPDGADHVPALRTAVEILAKGPDAASEIGEAFLKGRALAIWRKALLAGPAASIDATLETLKQDDGLEACVCVAWMPASALAASPRRFVRLLGLNSSRWPRGIAEDRLIPDHIIPTPVLDPLPVNLADRRDFETILATTADTVVLSRARRDSDGRLLGRSPLLAGRGDETYLRRNATPAHAFSETDRLMARPQEFAADPQAVGAQGCWRDWRQAEITPHDGLVRADHPLVLAILGRTQSASSLRRLLRNPLSFVWVYAFGWREPQSSAEPLVLDALGIGDLVHWSSTAPCAISKPLAALPPPTRNHRSSGGAGRASRRRRLGKRAPGSAGRHLGRTLDDARVMAGRALSYGDEVLPGARLRRGAVRRLAAEIRRGDALGSQHAGHDSGTGSTSPATSTGSTSRATANARLCATTRPTPPRGDPAERRTRASALPLCLRGEGAPRRRRRHQRLAALSARARRSSARRSRGCARGDHRLSARGTSKSRRRRGPPGPDTGGDYDDLAFALPANASATYCKRKMPAATERLGEVAQVWEAE